VEEGALSEIYRRIKICQNVHTITHSRDRKTQKEVELMQRPCYRFSKLAKEQFFSEPYFSVMFLKMVRHHPDYLTYERTRLMGQDKMQPFKQAVDELTVFAERTFQDACQDQDLPQLLVYAKTCGLM